MKPSGNCSDRDFSFASCAGKIGYPSAQAAAKAVHHLSKKAKRRDAMRKASIGTYQCRICRQWHVGRSYL